MTPDRDPELVADRLIEQVLRRPGGGASSSCPEADTLGAFVERHLTADEANRLERHLAGCARCQEALAALARALPVVQPQAGHGWGGWGWLSSPWRWAVPATAVALLVSVWVVARLPVEAPPSLEGTLAQVQAPAAPVPAEHERDELRAGDVAKAAPDDQVRQALPEDEPAVALSRPGAGATAAARGKAEPAGDAPGAARSNEADRAKGGRLPATADATRADATAVPPPAAAPPQTMAGAEAAAAMAAPAEAARPAESKETPSPPLPSKRAQETGRRALAPRASEIVSADGAARWRFGFAGMLFRSADGMTWERQDTGTTLDLLAGAAPEASVCWLVGRDGLVLLTTDGERWSRVPFTEVIDLIQVEARDARAAIVTAADDRRFETTDGGQTWSRVR